QKFVQNFKGQISEVIKLEAPDGNIYNVQAIKDLNKIVLGSGWGVFVRFYELKAGYFLVFRYIGDSHFKVLIFDFASCCEKEVFHVLMNCGPNAQEKDTRLDRSLLGERRCQNGGSSNSESHRRCEHCDVHFYWHHMDDRQKHFLRFMVGDFLHEMNIPEKFVNNFRGRISKVMKLEAPDGNVYNIQVTNDLNKITLRSGWAAFASAYELKEHDLLVFSYTGNSHFRVLIFDPSGCEKELFRIVMNHTPNVQKGGISHDQLFLKETRRRDGGSRDNNPRKTKKMTLLDSPSPKSAEGVTSPEDTMNSSGPPETTEPRYVLATGCNLTTAQKAQIDTLVKKIRPVIPFYITAMNKTSLSGSLVICKDYAAKYLPHEDQFITLCHPRKSNIWLDNLKVTTDGSGMLSAGWSCFVLHNELRESDVCVFEVSKSAGEMTMVVHSLEGGHHLQDRERARISKQVRFSC
uniref:TF-B3 domain-containing protein n=1 Tax=Aegilops tauschii subsp. strangulata TaxID=200361 RepID=A0A453JU03_AEGTS